MKHYIYALTDQNNNIFYIGKSINPDKRKKRHIYDAKSFKYSYPVHNKIRKLIREGFNIGLKIIESNISDNEIDKKEQFWILDYRKKGFKIYNVANGGEGGKGATPEMIEKVRQAHLGKKVSDATKKKISESNKGKVLSKEHRENLSKARKLRKTTNETRIKMKKASEGKINIKKYKLIDPNGTTHYTTNGLADFCRHHKLSRTNLYKVISGTRENHKEWKIERI